VDRSPRFHPRGAGRVRGLRPKCFRRRPDRVEHLGTAVWSPSCSFVAGASSFDPLTRPAPADDTAGCRPPSPPRGRGLQNTTARPRLEADARALSLSLSPVKCRNFRGTPWRAPTCIAKCFLKRQEIAVLHCGPARFQTGWVLRSPAGNSWPGSGGELSLQDFLIELNSQAGSRRWSDVALLVPDGLDEDLAVERGGVKFLDEEIGAASV